MDISGGGIAALRRSGLLGVAAVCVLLFACASSLTSAPDRVERTAAPALQTAVPPAPEPSAPRPEWRIGVVLSLSGPMAVPGRDTKDGIDLAVAEVNAGGAPRHRGLHLIYKDDQSVANEVTSEVRSFIEEEPIVALLGGVTSVGAHRLGRFVSERKLPMISSFATDTFTTQGAPFLFRTCFVDQRQAQAAARFAVRELGKKKFAILSAQDDHKSAYLARWFKQEVTRLGGGVVVEETFSRSASDLSAQLQSLKKRGPDIVYTPLPPGGMISVVRQATAAGLPGGLFLGAEGWDLGEFLRYTGADLEGAHFTNHWAADAPWPRARAFAVAFRQRYQREPSSLAATGYDAALVLADALGRARDDTPEALRDALQATHDFAGATGVITIDPERDAEKDVLVLQVVNGKPTFRTSVRVMEGPDAPLER